MLSKLFYAFISSFICFNLSFAQSYEKQVLKFDIVAYQTNTPTAFNNPDSVVKYLSGYDDWSHYNINDKNGIHIVSAISIDNVPLVTDIETSTLSDKNTDENKNTGQYK